RKAGSCRLLRNVDVANWPPDDTAGRVERSNSLFGEAVERIHPKRYGIIEDAGSAPDDRLLVLSRCPHKPSTRSGARRESDGLLFEAHPQVQGEMRIQHPMVLRVHGGRVVGEGERLSTGKVDALLSTSIAILNLHRPCSELALIFAIAQHRAELQDVIPGKMKRARRPVLDPHEACRLARLLAEVAATIAERAQQHFCSVLGLDPGG